MSEGVPFGPYRLLRRLARGGMAEIFLARKDGPEGFSRTLVVKRILPHLVRDRSFVSMFLSEARIAALLAHPNVVHVYDFGEVDGSYYLAMEHVRGVDMRAVIDRAVELGHSRPAVRLAHAVRMVSSVCEGLAHAHGLREGGRPLGLVHRDVTPSNVLVSFDGAVKVADFGIAKVRQEATRDVTQAGIVKGKIAYLSPEQARGETLDRRSDLFNAGLLLYECFVGRPLLSPAAVERARKSPDDPRAMLPTAVSIPGAPEGLVQIVRRATEPDRGARYVDALAMRTDLEDLLRELPETSGTVEIGAYVRELFDVPADVDGIDLGMRAEPVGARTESRVAPGTRSAARADAGGRTATAQSVARGPTATSIARAPTDTSLASVGDEGPTELVSLDALRERESTEGSTLTATVVEPRTLVTRIPDRGSRLPAVALVGVLGASGVVALVALLVTWAASSPSSEDPGANAARAASSHVEPSVPPGPGVVAAPSPATLAIESTPVGATVVVDGVTRGRTPMVIDDAIAGSHDIVLTLEGHAPSHIAVALAEGERRTVQAALASSAEPTPSVPPPPRPSRAERAERPAPPAAEPERAMGTLTIATNPSSEVFVGRRRLGWTPLRARLPAGRHTLTLRARDRPERRTTVLITPDGDARVRLTL